MDGNNHSCAKIIAKKGEFAWWRVYLEEDYYIDKVIIYFKPNSSGWLLLSLINCKFKFHIACKLKIKFHAFVDVFTINYFNVYVSNDNNNFEKDVCEGFNTTTELTKLSRSFI